MKPICTPSSTIREWTLNDVESLVKHANNPRIAATMRDAFPSPYTSGDAHRFIDMATGQTNGLFLAIARGDEAVGGIGFHTLDDVKHRTAEIGYWLSETCWGRGIGTDAVRSIIPVAFGEYDLLRLQAGVFSNNPASMRVLEKCGFYREAVHRQAIIKRGEILDEVVFALLIQDLKDRGK